jgi:hypothetical protein
MRNRFMFLGLSASLVTGAAAFLACSGSTESTGGGDAGSDVTVVDSGPKDAGVDAKDSAPPCDTTADFVSKIPDASIADGASTTGICAGCLQAKCATEVDKCNKDCTCQGIADTAITCYAQNTSDPLQCIGDFASAPSATRSIGLALFSCVSSNCVDECAVNSFISDAGDAGDAD